MSNSAEQSFSPEVLSVQEADAYIRAVNTVLSQNSVPIPGLRYEEGHGISASYPGMEPTSSIVLDSTLDPDENPIHFRLVAYPTNAFNETTISQIVQGNSGSDVDLRRWHTGLSDETNYVIVRSSEDDEEIDYKRVASQDELKDAEALFTTLATDFKGHMEQKLAGRADLLDAIAWTSHHPNGLAQKPQRWGFLGRLLLRKP